MIFRKAIMITRAARQTDEFETRFWSGTELTKLLDTANRNRETSGSEERVFAAGMNEYLKQQRSSGDVINGVSRAMRAVFTRELDHLESGLPLLASIGSTSPYIGLFGTVWGIMNAFTGLSTLDNVSLAVVAPGIAEALVATAIGLFAAIPAVAVGVVIVVAVAAVIFGGVNSIARVCEWLVPIMAGAYALGCLVIMGMNAPVLGEAVGLILECAFTPKAAFGGAVGSGLIMALQFGCARGLFSNESGLGTAPSWRLRPRRRTPPTRRSSP